ncbi:alpha/beta fold hydrolase [Salinibacterium soli]|uniref:Alpha/beta fold hydrolase n=1 Tax=Antiquaquibacter soli TaxID=3064523 RepID=A0ABT9BRE6_9MICO|nr:alpha/beta fold hydrolase [Protaetiibacter sp. WY-16]MDO7883608.1 alpha/beta fold hydrolase [Protaetiibacter sp. WY-16]
MTLPTVTWGTPGGPRALLVHGLSSESGSWWHLAPALVEEGWHVTAVDLRGHGAAARADSYALADYAGDLPRQGWDLVVGHSLGGASTVLAAQDAGFARRLVLLDPVLHVPAELWDETIADQVSELELTAETIAELKPHWHERDRAAKLEGVRAVHPDAVSRTFTDSGTWDIRSEAEALGVPTLIVSGDPEVYTMLAPETAARVAANPRVDYVIVPGTGHSPHRDRPDETMAVIREWLARG